MEGKLNKLTKQKSICTFLRVDIGKRKTVAQMKESNQGGNMTYIVISCQEDVGLVTDILEAKMGIFSAEFILSSVMRCEMDFDLSQYLTPV